jgi:cytidine deaminase
METQELVEAARAAALGSYSPYSEFRVGAIVVGTGGEVFSAANVENAAYPSGACAEATAIGAAVSHGVRSIQTVVVACVDAADTDGAYPCGRCRQVMSEFDVERIVVTGADGSEVREHTLDEILPHRFNL